MKNVDLLKSPSIMGTTRSLMASNLPNSVTFLDHGIHSALVLVTSHRNGSSWSVLIQDTHLTCTTAFGTPDPLADIFHIHTTFAISCFHMPMNFDWRATVKNQSLVYTEIGWGTHY
jgi:hypothetical protein